jgi:hypothetical protein
MSEQEGRTPRQDNQEANTRNNTHDSAPATPQQGGAEAQPIFSPAEQQGAKPFLLTPMEEQQIEALLQPEGEPYNLNQYVIRSLRGLRALEYKVDLTETFNGEWERLRERARTVPPEDPRKRTPTAEDLRRMEINKHKDEAYLKGLKDAYMLLRQHIKIKGSQPYLHEEDD